MATYLTTFDEIKYLAWLSSNTFSDSTGDTAMIKRLLNNSNKKNWSLANAQYQDTTISTVASTPQYTLPSDFSAMVSMYFLQWSRKIPIREVAEDKFLMLESIVSNALQFLYYTIRKTTIATVPTKQFWIYPIPSGVATVYYKYIATQSDLNLDPAVTTDSTRNLIAENGFEILDTYYVLYHLYMVREQPEQAREWKAEYDKKWKEYKAYLANMNDSLVVKQGVQSILNPNLFPVLS